MFSDMFKKQLSLEGKKKRTGVSGMTAAFVRGKRARPVLITGPTHMSCHRNGTKWDQFRSDATCLRESSFSKTLISGPQISCQSSAGDRHGIGEEAVPNKSTTRQSGAPTHARSRRHEKKEVHTLGEARAHTHTRRGTGGCVLRAPALPPLD